ncbi:MAG: glycosyltransferase [Desulfomonile sp.]|nr:glycosyltransferase [Desulfomonile sp.]
MPLVSVIIPTYNRAGVIGRAVRSVLAQSHRDLELIVVDDGSTDGTAKALAEFSHEATILRQPNRGVSSARNLGISHAKGELIAFLDSDDEWLPDKVARQVERYRVTDSSFVCHTDEIWLRDGKPVRQKAIHRKQGGRFFERALERCLISPSAVMLSRALLDRVGWFDESLPAAEDYDLWLRITAFHAVEYVPEPLVVKHGGLPNQLSMTVPAIDRFRIRAIEKIIADPLLSAEYRQAARCELIRKCAVVAGGAAKRGNTADADYYRELARSHQDLNY